MTPVQLKQSELVSSIRALAQIHEFVVVALGHGAGSRGFLKGILRRHAVAAGHLESVT